MLTNFFKIATRNILHHKAFSIINIAGLTLGLSACLLIGLFVNDEHSYDRLPGGEQVYRVYNHYTTPEGEADRAVTPPMFATTLRQEYPEVEAVTRVMQLPENNRLFEAGYKKFYESSGFFVDSTFFDVFDLPFKYGTPAGALNDPSSIVLSQEMAYRFFGTQDPVGKQILLDKSPYTVKGVFDQNPKFHLQFKFLAPLAAVQIPQQRMESWSWQQFYNYAKIKSGTDIHALEAKFQKLVKERSAPFMKDMQSSNKPYMQRLADIHLYSANFKFDVPGRGNIAYVNALTVIAIFILLIACFNFINLATAKSLQRAKEVGVRKSIGASRKQLIFQFIGETVLYSFMSIVLATVLAMLLLPWLNRFTGKHIAMGLFASPTVLLMLLLLGIITGVLAGFYPALVLSAFKPSKVLKSSGGVETPGRAAWLRQALVVGQFTLSALLLISTIVVFRQVLYLHNKNLGFNKEEIMFFPMRGDEMFRSTEAFKNRLLQAPGVTAVSIGYGFPGDAVAGDEIRSMENGKWITHPATQLMVDYDYIKTLGLKVIAGRSFDKTMQTDKNQAFMLNETAVRQLGFETAEKAIGQKLAWSVWGASQSDSLKTGTVIGVVQDFNYKSLYDKVETAVLQIFPDAAWKVAVKIKTTGVYNSIKEVEKAWNAYSPEYPLEYKFLDENFEEMYRSEDKLKTLVWIFTGIALFVGCLGLFGLAAFTAERRKKEVGIRKVLGASTRGIVLLLSKNFVGLVILSLVIASPVAWFFMHQWLQNFAYRVDISWWIFALAAFIALMIAFVTVSFQAIKAALTNPVKSLRTE